MKLRQRALIGAVDPVDRAERRDRWGDAVPPGFVRLSVGIEPTETLLEAVQKTLKNLS